MAPSKTARWLDPIAYLLQHRFPVTREQIEEHVADYRDAEALRQPDGSVLVTFEVAGPSWLIRHVLQYGPDAEVLEPAQYREAVWRAVGQSS